MVFAEIERIIQPLSRSEKLQLIQFITTELLEDELLHYYEPGKAHGLWSPYNEQQAAHQLAGLLERKP